MYVQCTVGHYYAPLRSIAAVLLIEDTLLRCRCHAAACRYANSRGTQRHVATPYDTIASDAIADFRGTLLPLILLLLRLLCRC